jgi:hypothetical protein
MSRESICDDWRVSLAHCEDAAEDAPPRYQWLYRVRARIYRILLAMYGGEERTAEETWDLPDPEFDDSSSAVFVAAGVKDAASPPVKSKAQLLSTLKRIADSNDPVPMGGWTGEDVRQQLFLVADVVKKKDLQLIRAAFNRAELFYMYRSQGSHHQLLVDPSDRVAAMMIVKQARRNHVQRQRREYMQRRVQRNKNVQLLLDIASILLFSAGIAVVASALLDVDPNNFQPQLSWGFILLVAGPSLFIFRRYLSQPRILPPPADFDSDEADAEEDA